MTPVTQSWPFSPRFFLSLGQETTLEQMKTIQFYSQLSDFTHLCGFQSWHSTRLRKSGLRQAHLEGKNKRRCLAALVSSTLNRCVTMTMCLLWACDRKPRWSRFVSMLACVSMCCSVNAARALKKCAELAAVEATVSEQKGFSCLMEPRRRCSRQQFSILHPVLNGA